VISSAAYFMSTAKLHERIYAPFGVLAPGLAVLDPALPPELIGRTPLAVAWRRFDQALERFIDRQVIAA
jgi:hypothetical protein